MNRLQTSMLTILIIMGVCCSLFYLAMPKQGAIPGHLASDTGAEEVTLHTASGRERGDGYLFVRSARMQDGSHLLATVDPEEGYLPVHIAIIDKEEQPVADIKREPGRILKGGIWVPLQYWHDGKDLAPAGRHVNLFIHHPNIKPQASPIIDALGIGSLASPAVLQALLYGVYVLTVSGGFIWFQTGRDHSA
jgi:acyl-CoA synthetase (AMP-forming)/AMP-acid ligase II